MISLRRNAGSNLSVAVKPHTRLATAEGPDSHQGPAQDRRAILDASLDPLMVIAPEGGIVEANKAAIKVTGMSRESLIGAGFASLFTEPDLARELCRQALQKGEVRGYPLTFRAADGTLTDVSSSASLYRGSDGKVIGVVVSAHDVTGSNRVMNELVEAKSFLDNILQSSTKYSIIGKDLQRRILSWNEGARRNYGYEAEEVIGKDSSILHAPEDILSGAVDRLVLEAHDKGIAEGEFVRVRKDGSHFVASVVMTRRNDSAGNAIGYLVMSHDITDKKQAEERLHQASRYARSLIEASLDPLLTISAGGKITDVNEATTMVTGASRDELTGTDFSRYFTDSAKAEDARREVFQKGSIRNISLTFRHGDGTLTDVLCNASVYRDEQGNVLGALAAARDVTERKRAIEKLRELNDALEQRIAQRAAQNREILEIARVLAGSSSDIMASVSQIASGVTETAYTVNKTASTVNEAKGTAQVSSEKARKVSEVAQQAVAVAQTGRKAVEESIAAMARIQDQVSFIAEGIGRLSEQGQSIAEIIATVKDLAEQANLLAVNAAIEAAKASEQGKGFGVVAQELKSLAEQSKLATVQVRAILNDIQKASKSAIMATEEGKEVVAAGVRQSEVGGEVIRQMETIISDAAQSGVEIGESSQQQLEGMDEVAQAMRNIRQASDDNAKGIRQVETSLQKLNELGQQLKLLVERYQ